MDPHPPKSSGKRRHLISITDLRRADIERILGTAEGFESVMQRDLKKVPTLRGRTVMTVFFEASTRTSSSFELAAKRLSADTISLKAAGSSVDKGESLRDTRADALGVRPGRDRDPPPGGRLRGHDHRLDRGARRERRRRDASAPDAVPARPLHDARRPRRGRGPPRGDRGRRPALPRRPLQHPRAAHDGRARHAGRPADADPARRGGARGRRVALDERARGTPMSSTSFACSASAWRPASRTSRA